MTGEHKSLMFFNGFFAVLNLTSAMVFHSFLNFIIGSLCLYATVRLVCEYHNEKLHGDFNE